jgi:hypothetical protein
MSGRCPVFRQTASRFPRNLTASFRPAIALFPGPRFHGGMFNPTAPFAALIVCAFLWADNSLGQQPPKSGPPVNPAFNRYSENLVIPFSQEVVNDLGLNEAQRIRAKKLALSLPKNPNGKDLYKLKQDTLKLLTTEQQKRLEQLTCQYRGALASFHQPEIAGKLRFNADQKQRLATIQFLQRSGAQNLNEYEKVLYGPTQNRGRFLARLRRSSDCLAESVLVPAQMMKWRDLQGKPLSPRPADWD